MIIEALNAESVRQYRREIAQLYYENMHECSCLDHYTYETAYDKIGDFISHLEKDAAIGYGLFEDTDLCGYIWAYPHRFREENRMYVNEIRVREDCRGKGYGKALLTFVEAKAKEQGIGAVYLHAEASNPDTIRFYESVGYHPERIQFRKECE